MTRRRDTIPLNVFLNGRIVGVLRRESTGAVDFRYADEWLTHENSFPVSLSLPLREDRYIGAPVVNVFDNLLPDNEDIRKRIAQRVNAGGVDSYSLLAALGHDCVGALQFLPDGVDPGPAGVVTGKPVTNDEIGEIISNLADTPLGVGEDKDFRISIAGAQEKTALLRLGGEWFKPIGTTATTHILKPQIGQIPNGMDLSNSVENEYLCLKLLAALNVHTPTAEIADFGGQKTLVIERFDRHWTDDGRLLRLPQEDMCQALSVSSTRKYQSDGGPGMFEIIQLLKGSDRPDDDIALFMRACILFWLLGATDGHAKNFSIFLNPGGLYRMTPLYDVLTAQESFDTGHVRRNKFKLAMSAGNSRHYAVDDIMPRHFLQTAVASGIGTPRIRAVFEYLATNALDQADKVISILPPSFPEKLVVSVRSAVQKRARLLADTTG